MSPAEKRAYVLADNKLALNPGWDEELLALELKELMEADIASDISVTGSSIAEIDSLIGGLAPEEEGDDRLLDPDRVPSRLWARRRPAARARTSSSATTRSILMWSRF
jgi:hypothetical protein